MIYEVEQKFRVTDFDQIEESLHDLGATFHPPIQQEDKYFAHPSRDFSSTDEAFRIRRVGASNFVTYKGPKIDKTTKTRHEIELPLPHGEQIAKQFEDLFAALGFAEVAVVCKDRRRVDATWNHRTIEVALDDVHDVGRFVELELSADQATLESCKECLAALATKLNLTESERRSYLELLLTKSSQE